MKTISILALFLLTFVYVPTFAKAPAQFVDIDGKKMQVASRSSLNAKTDYYLLQETADSPAKAYLKTEEGFTATVFSFAELQNYLVSGDLSALGRVVEVPLADGQQVQYVEKGDVAVIISKEATQVSFTENSGSINKLISQLSITDNSLQTCEVWCSPIVGQVLS